MLKKKVNDWPGKPKYSNETCSSTSLSPTNPTWHDSVSNPGRRGGKPPTTKRLSFNAFLAILYKYTSVNGALSV